MIYVHSKFVATKHPGYFWNTEDKKLYSCKSGILCSLTLRKPNYFSQRVGLWESYYQVSVNGKSKYMTLTYLEKLENTVSNYKDYRFPEEVT